MYNIDNLKEDLKNFDYKKYKELPEDKAYKIHNNLYNFTSLRIHQRSITGALAEYLSGAGYERDAKNCIELGYFGYSYPYNNADDITAEELSEEETQAIYNALRVATHFSKVNSYAYYYMIEYGNGYTEEEAAAYNFIAHFRREKYRSTLGKRYPNWQEIIKILTEIYTNLPARVEEDIKKEKEQTKKDEEFINAFTYIFNNNLDFNIDLQLDNEKKNGLHEKRAFEIVEKIGSYNIFNLDKFYKITSYLNHNFIKYYGEGNCNNYRKDYNINFGREGSPVMYIRTHFKTEAAIDNTLKELQKISGADEASITKKCEYYNGCIAAVMRLWWD